MSGGYWEQIQSVTALLACPVFGIVGWIYKYGFVSLKLKNNKIIFGTKTSTSYTPSLVVIDRVNAL